MNRRTIRTGVVGCGAISDIYLTNMIQRFDNLEVVACCAKHLERAQAKAQKYGIRACTYAEMLEDDSIEMVVILTPAPTHYELIRAALLRGKHVYTEKTMSVDPAQARELVQLADARGLYLGSAPDTFLGAALQTARQAVDEGRIGRVTSFLVSANRDLDYFAGKYNFLLMPGGGICFDYGVYYLTALVSLLGPMQRTAAIVQNNRPIRENRDFGSPQCGQTYSYDNESQVSALLQTESGVSGVFSLNGDSVRRDRAVFLLYGTDGILKLTCPDEFGGDVVLLPNVSAEQLQPAPVTLECKFDFAQDSRGVGPAEMAAAILEGRANRASKEMAYHVLDTIQQIMNSSARREFVEIRSTCARPAPMVPGAL